MLKQFDLDKLKCPICQQLYTKPMILPCGSTLCSYCVTALILENPNEYKCRFCNKYHILSEENLSINQTLTNLITEFTNQFNSNLNNLLNTINKLEFNLNNPDIKIKEYCSQLKHKIQYLTAYRIQNLAENQTIEQLIESNEQMLNQIDLFESDRINKYVKATDFELMLNKAKLFCTEWKNLNENDFVLDVDLVNFIYDLEFKFEIESSHLKRLIYNNQILKLIDRDLIECSMEMIDYNHLNNIDFKKQLNKIKKLYDKNLHLIESFRFNYSGSGCFSNNNVVVAFCMIINYKELSEQDFNLSLVQFDKNKSLVKYKLIKNISDANLIVNSDKCVIDCTLFGSCKESISVFDKDFSLVKEFKTKNQSLIAVNDSCIFCVNKDLRKEPIVVYDWSFRVLKKIGQSNPKEEFYFTNDICYFESLYGKYYIVEENQNSKQRLFKIFDQLRGYQLSEIELDSTFDVNVCTNNSRFLIYDSNILSFINPSGNLLSQIKLVNFPSRFSLSYDNLANLICIDETIYL